MVKKPKGKEGEGKDLHTVPPPMDLDGVDAYYLMIAGLKNRFQPLGDKSTLVLVPKGYDESHPHSKHVHFSASKHQGGVKVFYIPREELIQVSILKIAHLGDKVYYLASYGGHEIIVNQKMCAPIGAKMIGPFKAK